MEGELGGMHGRNSLDLSKKKWHGTEISWEEQLKSCIFKTKKKEEDGRLYDGFLYFLFI